MVEPKKALRQTVFASHILQGTPFQSQSSHPIKNNFTYKHTIKLLTIPNTSIINNEITIGFLKKKTNELINKEVFFFNEE